MNAGNIGFPTQRHAAILIVDDAPANLAALRSMLADQGYQTFIATSGERALKIASRVRPDLILLDVVMPGLDGFDTCRQLKRHADTEDIPVIFMSARTETDDVVEWLSALHQWVNGPLKDRLQLSRDQGLPR